MKEKREKPTRRKAVALRYDEECDRAPRVVASGEGELAERLLEIAREHAVVVHEDPLLAGALAQLDVGVEVPEELFQAVAEVLAFVYRLDERLVGEREGESP